MKIKNILKFSIYIVILIALFEFYFRLLGISLPSFVTDNNTLGRTHKAKQQIFSAGGEGFCIDEINEFGYTGNGYPQKRKNGTIRIALYGSSYIEGLQVFRRNRFSTIFENKLADKLGKNIEVLNFAIGGDDFRGMFFRFLTIGQKYNPDINIFFIQNQALLNKKTIPSPSVKIIRDSININYDYLNLEESKIRKRFQFVRNTAIGNLIKESFEVYYSGRIWEIILDKLNFINKNEKRKIEEENLDELNLSIFNYISNWNKNNNSKNIVVLMDNLSEKYLKLLKNDKNLIIFDLYGYLKSYSVHDLHYWKASNKIGHWNNFAHRIVAEFLTDNLFEYLNDKRIILTNREN